MPVSIIAALDTNNVIGHGTVIPWNIPEERRVFHSQTEGSALIMGRITYESIGRPLPGRTTTVISTQPLNIPGASVAPSLTDAITQAKTQNGQVYIAGGATIYKQALELSEIDAMYLSHLHTSHSTHLQKDNLVYFPAFEEDTWKVVEEVPYQAFILKTYKRYA